MGYDLDESVLPACDGWLSCMCADERMSMGWQARIWGHTRAGGMVQSSAAGHFV